MTSNNETSGYESITRRKLLASAAVSTTFFGSGCIGDLNGDQSNQTPTQTTVPPPTDTDTPTETSNNELLDEEGLETATDTETPTTEEPTETATETPTETTTEDSFQVENPNQFGWETEDNLEETTGFCYLEQGNYLGAMDADEVESALDEEHLYGEDPNNALNDGELIGAIDPLKPVGGAYAVDVDARQGEEIQYYVQLVGEQDGGVYVNRQGAYELSELEWDEVFNEC